MHLFIIEMHKRYPWIMVLLCFNCDTICPGSSDPFFIVSYYTKWVTTSWTHSNIVQNVPQVPRGNAETRQETGTAVQEQPGSKG